MLLSPLPFDSDLFGYPVGKCQIAGDWDEESFLRQAKDYRLVYIFSKKTLKNNSTCIHLADTKLTFEKGIQELESSDLVIVPYSGELTEPLLNLALASGVFSRFHTDPGFVKGEYGKLYSLWIKNALSQNEVLIADQMSGFVSCSISGEKANIGLIAVDKNQRGKGWGKRLVRAAENFAQKKGAKSMTIGTQEANIPAIALYRSLGYEVVERMYLYHYRFKYLSLRP